MYRNFHIKDNNSPVDNTVNFNTRVVHKLRLQDLTFFNHLPPLRLHFIWYKSLQKVDFFTTYPPPLVNVFCERPPIVNDPNYVALSAMQWVGKSTELNAKLVSLSIQKYA